VNCDRVLRELFFEVLFGNIIFPNCRVLASAGKRKLSTLFRDRHPTHITHIGKAPQLVPTFREANATTKTLSKSAIFPPHTARLDNYILFFEMNLYFSRK
jgi:hypothetical protein